MNALEREVLELIGEDPDSPDVFVDTDVGMAPVRDSINDAIQEIAMLTGGYKRQYFLPLREGQMFYRFRQTDGELGWVTDAWNVTSKFRLEQTDLIRLTSHDPRWMVHSGNPESYLTLGRDLLGVYPKPSGSSNVLELTFVEIPFAYRSGEDRIKLRDQFHYAAVHYAVAEYWATRGDATEAQTHLGLYLDALGLKQDYIQQSEAPRFAQTHKEPWPKVTDA